MRDEFLTDRADGPEPFNEILERVLVWLRNTEGGE